MMSKFSEWLLGTAKVPQTKLNKLPVIGGFVAIEEIKAARKVVDGLDASTFALLRQAVNERYFRIQTGVE